ncbi:MAG: PDZ domain-containing protein [bacterium]
MIALFFVLLAAPAFPGIHEEPPGHFKVARAALEASEGDRPPRIIPRMEAGKAAGVKLYGIRRRSLAGALGFQNGDAVVRVNGKAIDGPDRLLKLYQELKGVATLTVDLERRGQPMTLHYTLTDEAIAADPEQPEIAPDAPDAPAPEVTLADAPAPETLAGVEAVGPGRYRAGRAAQGHRLGAPGPDRPGLPGRAGRRVSPVGHARHERPAPARLRERRPGAHGGGAAADPRRGGHGDSTPGCRPRGTWR